MNRPDSVHAWVTAWEAAMAEAGHPRARIDIDTHLPTEAKPFIVHTYAWTADLDATDENDQSEWDDAHRAFLLVDEVRPESVLPSIVLQQLLAHASRPK